MHGSHPKRGNERTPYSCIVWIQGRCDLQFINEFSIYSLKVPQATPYLQTAVMHRCHTIIQKKCVNEIFLQPSSIRNKIWRSQYEDKLQLEMLLTRSNICIMQEATETTNEWFWVNVRKPKNLDQSWTIPRRSALILHQNEDITVAWTVRNRKSILGRRTLMVKTMLMTPLVNSSVAGDVGHTEIDLGNNMNPKDPPFDNLSNWKKKDTNVSAL